MKRLLALCALMLLLCACVPLGTPTPSASATPAVSAPTPTAMPAPTPGVYYTNPLSAFYAACEQDVSATLRAFHAALAQDDSIDSLQTQMRLNAHLRMLNQAAVSVGRLTASGSYYSDTLIGAASGSGTLTPSIRSDGVYTLAFLYYDSRMLTGTLDSNALLFSLHTAVVEEVVTESLDEETGEMLDVATERTVPGEQLCRAGLYKTPGAWLSIVMAGDEASVLRLHANGADFLLSVPPPDMSAPEYSTLASQARRSCLFENGTLTYSSQNHS